MFLKDEKGSATAEYAILTPVIVLMLLIVLGVVSYCNQNIKCEIAARDIARNLIVKDTEISNDSIAQKIVGSNSSVSINSEGDYKKIKVTASMSKLLPFLPKISTGTSFVYVQED
jgi:uncharacterized protein (UPF0333 family)